MDRRIEDYLAYLDSVRGLSARTVSSYSEDLQRFEAHLAASRKALAPGATSGEGAKGLDVDGVTDRDIRAFAARDVDEVTARDIRAFAAALVAEGKAGSSVNRALSAVRGYYRYRVRYGALKVDPARDVEGLPSRRALPRFLFEDEAAAFISLASGQDFRSLRDRAILEVLYSTGCRVGEAANLTLGRLDLEGGTARVVGKGSKERVVFLAGPAREAVAAYLPFREALLGRLGKRREDTRREAAYRDGGDAYPRDAYPRDAYPRDAYPRDAYPRDAYPRDSSPWLFVNARGGRLTERGVEWLIEGYAARAGIPRRVTPHAFRHSFATHLVGRGADIRVVQELLGHASVSTTQVYAHVDMERLRKVYEQAHPHGGKK